MRRDFGATLPTPPNPPAHPLGNGLLIGGTRQGTFGTPGLPLGGYTGTTMVRDLKGLFGQAVQPWGTTPGSPDESLQHERDRLLSALASSDLGTIEARVGRILQDYPETRDSDTALAIRYWSEFQANVVAGCQPLALEVLHDLQPIMTLVRCRQRIQNDFGLFVGTRLTRSRRDERQLEFYRYLAEKRLQDPELCFYLDETGSDSTGRFVGVGGICVLDTRSYEMRHAALRQWRESQGWPETLHFADLNTQTEPRYLGLLQQLKKYRSGLLFVGYATVARGSKDTILSTLFVQLIGDALRVADAQGCLGVVRAVRVIKEAAAGFDTIHLASLEQNLSQHLLQLFPSRVYLRQIETVPKGRCVMLEAADCIAAAMKRRWESGRRIHKDRVAESVMNVTGFEDPGSESAMYKVHS